MKDDSIDGIYDTLKQCALISKTAGGIGLAVSCIRATGSYIAGVSKMHLTGIKIKQRGALMYTMLFLYYLQWLLFFRLMACPMGWFLCFECTTTQHVMLTRVATR